ncbi:glycosyl hydrolase [Mariannaea sp. PMI_226]|nr:glycosyl hydrolase [Mariannaea sp. PMI_226]
MPSISSRTGSVPQWHLHPTVHLKAPHGWLNDPCAPGYDVATGTYHLFYQWNPKSCDWGDICWGHFTSQDGLHWQHNRHEPVLEPSMAYDKDGIFTGCLYPTGPNGEQDQVTIFYSSVCNLPLNWAKPYRRDCTGLACAVSKDMGKTWQKSSLNPILTGEPESLIVTGFRDPYLAEWPALDAIRGGRDQSLYGVISGGVLDKGPMVFLYTVAKEDLTKWEYIGPLVEFPLGQCYSRKWSGDFGANWECANFMTLRNGADEGHFLIAGSEGGLKRDHETKSNEDPYVNWCLWIAGRLKAPSEDNSSTKIQYDYGGLLDNGCFYAANSYEHPIAKTRIVWGWLKEEDLTINRRKTKGWTGYLSLPRELFYLSIPNVVRALETPLADITSVKVVDNSDGTKTLKTLGIRPLPGFAALRTTMPQQWFSIGGHQAGGTNMTKLFNSTHWEVEAVIRVQAGLKRVGFYVQHNEDLSKRTTIFFDSRKEEIVVDRSASNNEDDIKKGTVQGPFTLFYKTDQVGGATIEDLTFRLFGDGDVLEIFANDRFALSTMLYADAATCSGISCFVEGADSDGVVFKSITMWQNLHRITSH